MSAYVVKDTTINAVVTWISSQPPSGYLRRKLTCMGIDPHEQLGNRMFELNVKAVNYRYGENEAEKFRPLDYRFSPVPANLCQTLKSLECWLYQCYEGAVPAHELYKFLDGDVKVEIMRQIVEMLPQYQKANWD